MGLFDRILRRLRGKPEPAPQDAPGLFTARSPGVSTEPSAPPEGSAPPEDLWDRPDPTPASAVAGTVEPDVTEPVVMEPGVLEPEDVAPEDEPAEADDLEDGVAGPIDPEAELAAIEELAPPAAEPETPVDPVWDEDAWAEAGATTELPEQTVEDAPLEDAIEDAVAPAGSTADEPLFRPYETAPEPPEAEEPAPDPVPPLFDPPEVTAEPGPEDLAPEVAAYIDPEPTPEPEPIPEPEPTPEPVPITPDPEPEPITPEPEPAPVTPEPAPEPLTPDPEPAPEAEAEPRPLVVETHPEVFDAAPAEDASPADAPEPETAAERTMRVHDERLDKRPGPIRMTPSEAIRLAQDGPRATRRPDDPEA